MQAISNALNRLLEDGAFFIRATEAELFAVRVSGDLRKSALQILAGLEFLPENTSPWIVLEDAYVASDDGWTVRASRVLANWEDRRKAFRERERIELPPAQPTAGPRAAGNRLPPSALSFRDALAGTLRAIGPPMRGMVVVMAPTLADDIEELGVQLEALIADRALGPCRWVWVLDAGTPWPTLLDRIGPRRLLRCECIPDPDQQQKDFKALVSSPPSLFGRAGPRGVTPPRRIDAPPPVDPEVRDQKLRAAGIEPEYLVKAPELRRLVLGAALAMKEGRGEDAVRMQREARELAVAVGRADATVICQVTLASYLSGLNQRDAAAAELRAAIELAERQGLGLQEAQARLALALLHALGRRFADAAHEYAACARRAEEADVPLIAIEAWRLAGQLACELKAGQQAASCFREAIRVAEGAQPQTVQASSASEAARRLAALCRDRGLTAQAGSLFEQADAMERGEVGTSVEG